MNQIKECWDIVHVFRYIKSKGGRLSTFIIGGDFSTTTKPSHSVGNWKHRLSQTFRELVSNELVFFFPRSFGLIAGFRIVNTTRCMEISRIQLLIYGCYHKLTNDWR